MSASVLGSAVPRWVGGLVATAAVGGGALWLAYPHARLLSRMYEADGRIELSVSELEKWNRRYPLDYESRWHAAELYLKLAQPSQALRVLDDMARDWPGDPRILAQLLVVQESRWNDKAVVRRLEALVELLPGDAELVQKLGDHHRWHGRQSDLIAALQRLVGLGHFPEERAELIQTLVANHRHGEAVPLLRENLEAHPGSVDIHWALYEAHWHSGERELALEHLRQVVELDGIGRTQALRELADALVAEGMHAEAGALVSEDILRHPVVPARRELAAELLGTLAWRLHQTGDSENAKRIQAELVALKPTELNARLRLADLYGEQAAQVAIVQLRELIGVAPASKPAWLALARRLSWEGEIRQAAQAFERALGLNANDRDCRRSLIRHLAWSGQYERALSHLAELLARRPTRADRLMAVDLHLDHGDPGVAMREAKWLVDTEPESMRFRSLYATAAVAAGRCDVALPQLQWLVEMNAGDFSSWTHLGICGARLGEEAVASQALDVLSKSARRFNAPGGG